MGVWTILGNHDYATYMAGTDASRRQAIKKLCHIERQMGWQLLLNENRALYRNGDSIFIAGMENDGQPPFPSTANAARTMQGIPPSAFTLMLEHDPSSWTRTILPKTTAQLTLSGHTHGGQIQLFGMRFTQIRQAHDLGLYCENGRYLYVNAGLGGVVPLRFNVNPEITVITLKKSKT